jgi:hypothetical protein
MVCGAPLTPPAKCAGCGHDVLAWQKTCPYCGKASEAPVVTVPEVPVPGTLFAPAPTPAFKPVPLSTPSAPLSPRPKPLEEGTDRGPDVFRILRVVFWTLVLAGLVGFVLYFRSAKGFWAVFAIVVWFILASRRLTRGRRWIRRTAPLHGDYEVSTRTVVVNLALSLALLGLSVVAWIAIIVVAFRKDFGASSTAFILGFLLFGGSLLTNYKYKSTKAAVINPDLEQHIDEFGYGIALIRQYYIWGLAPVFIHASFRLFF